ncbi:MAG: hypothetical protein P8Y48_17050 [Novosphingobium sp.]
MKSPAVLNPAEGEDAKRLMVEQAMQFRALLAAQGRSAKLTELFDYLLERSTEPRAPKEIEIAMAVFGKSAEFDTSQDSKVRAHIYRLRQRLETFNAGKTGMRLQIPKGEYRLLLSEESESEQSADPAVDERQTRSRQTRAWVIIGLCFGTSAMIWGLLWTLAWSTEVNAQQPLSSLRQTSFWAPIATHAKVPIIAASDFYMLAEGGPDGRIARLSMRPSIRSERDLSDYLRLHPDEYSKLHDRDIHRVPSSVAIAADTVLSLAASVRPDRRSGEIIPVSQISQNMIDTRSVIYIAHFSQLGMLRSPILHLSKFEPGADFDELKDSASGETFRALTKDTSPKNANGYDYGYIASFPGPSGNQVLVISGIEDPALNQMIRLISNKRQLDALSARVGGAKAFEALYRIGVTGGLVFDTKLLIARPLPDDENREVQPR